MHPALTPQHRCDRAERTAQLSLIHARILENENERLKDELADLRAIVGPIKAGNSIMVFQPSDEQADLYFRAVIAAGLEGEAFLEEMCRFYLRNCDDFCEGKAA